MPDYDIPASASGGVQTFTINAGQTATVTASGKWLTNPHGGGGPGDPNWCGAGGDGVEPHGSYPDRTGSEGCLCWRWGGAGIAPPGVGHFSSDNQSITMVDPATYTFLANDNNYDDNEGSITIHVTITP
jgi:hypothetical protein